MKKIKDSFNQEFSSFNLIKYRKSYDIKFNLKKEKLIEEYNEWIQNLYISMHLSKFRVVLSEIENFKKKYVSIPQLHWKYQIIQIRAIFRIIRKKFKKYREFLPKDNSHQTQSILFWFNQVVIILERLTFDFRLDNKPNKNQIFSILPIQQIYHGYIELLYLLIKFSYIKGEFHEILSYLAINDCLVNYSMYIVNINSMPTLQRILLIKAKIFLANCDYLNASRFIEKTIDLCLGQLNYVVDYRLNLESIDQDKLTMLNLFHFNKTRIRTLKNVLINIIIDFYLRGVLSELLGRTAGAIDSYKQSKFFATKFFKNKYYYYNFTMFFYHLQNNGYKYLAVMEELENYREVKEENMKIQQKEMIRKNFLKKLKYEKNYNKYYSTIRVKNDLYKGPLKNFLDKENIRFIKEEINRQGILSKFSKSKFITSTINLLNIYLAEDFRENLKKLETIEINKYPKEANDYLRNILDRNSRSLKVNRNGIHLNNFNKIFTNYKSRIKNKNKELGINENSINSINIKDLYCSNLKTCKSNRDIFKGNSIRDYLFNTNNKTNIINNNLNDINTNFIKNNYHINNSTSAQNLLNEKRTTKDSSYNTKFLKKGIDASFNSAMNTINSDFRIHFLDSSLSAKNIFHKQFKDSSFFSPRFNQIKNDNSSLSNTKELSKDNLSFRKNPLLKQSNLSERFFKIKIKKNLKNLNEKIDEYKINKDYFDKSLILKKNFIEKFADEEIKFHQKLLRTKICEIEPFKDEKFEFDLKKEEQKAEATYDRILEVCRSSFRRKNFDNFYKNLRLGETNKEEKKTEFKAKLSKDYNTKKIEFDINNLYMNNNLNMIGKNFIMNNNKQKIKILENEINRENKIIETINNSKTK